MALARLIPAATAVAGFVLAFGISAEKANRANAADKRASTPAVDRWEPEIRKFEEQDRAKPPAKGGIVFVGSSSIRLWDLSKSFPGRNVVNRGFGGSQLTDSVRYADRIVVPYQPRVVVLYAGDNDLASGKTPEQVAGDFRQFVAKIHQTLPKTKIVYTAIKPSISRWKLIDKVRATNAAIRQDAEKDALVTFVDVEPAMLGPDRKPRKELFRPDGLHLNAEGYRIWADLVGKHLGP